MAETKRKQKGRPSPLDYLTAGKFKGRMAALDIWGGPMEDNEPEQNNTKGWVGPKSK